MQFSLAEVGYPWLGSVASCMCVLFICRVLAIWFKLLQGLEAVYNIQLNLVFFLLMKCYYDCVGLVV